jgi:hypothetical protein
MKGIASTGAPKTLLDGWVGGWMDGWMGGKAGLRIAYSNQKKVKKIVHKKLQSFKLLTSV